MHGPIGRERASRRVAGRSRALILGFAALAAVAAAGCVRPSPAVSPVTCATPDGAVTSHVVVVPSDGLRPDAKAKFGVVTIERLMRAGSYTLDDELRPTHSDTARHCQWYPWHTGDCGGSQRALGVVEREPLHHLPDDLARRQPDVGHDRLPGLLERFELARQ